MNELATSFARPAPRALGGARGPVTAGASLLAGWLSISLSCALALAATGCGGPETDTGSTTSTTEPSACADDPRAQVYEVGLEGASTDDTLTITFLDADPSPPAKGNNTWKVRVEDADGNPVTGAAIETKAYMPDHGHSSSIKPTATEQAEDGVYEIAPINLFMPGIWEITLTVTPDGGSAAAVKFTFCVAG